MELEFLSWATLVVDILDRNSDRLLGEGAKQFSVPIALGLLLLIAARWLWWLWRFTRGTLGTQRLTQVIIENQGLDKENKGLEVVNQDLYGLLGRWVYMHIAALYPGALARVPSSPDGLRTVASLADKAGLPQLPTPKT